MSVISTIRTSCRDCYKCIRHCPVKAIRISLGHAEVVDERCIKDGRCVLVCPQGAKKVRSDLEEAKKLIASGGTVIASVAPSFVAAFPEATPGQVIRGLRMLGFSEVRETAEGAEWVAREHALLLQEGRENLITSSCPAVNFLITRYFPEHIEYLAPVVSPMVAHGRLLKREFPGASIVFIGPCIAKKAEAEEEEVRGDVDVVLTFSELREWFKEAHLELTALPEDRFSPGKVRFARAFPVEGGLIKSAALQGELLCRDILTITGVDRCKEFLKSFSPERSRFRIIEMMSCEGGCIDGPVLSSPLSPYERRERVLEYTEKFLKECEEPIVCLDPPSFRRTFSPSPVPRPEVPEEEIRRILALTGKFTPQDELNCGACGYNTCREKAEAVYQGMAEAEMCIPFMRTRAESFSSFLMTVTPNGIVLVDEDLRIVEMNPALRRMLGLVGKLVIGKRIDEFLDPSPFVEVLRTKKATTCEVTYPQYHNLFVRLSVFFLEKSHLLMGIFVDLTKEREQEAMMEAIREKTIEKAQQVIANQMRVAQEIASLLGETTAETKVLLNKLMRILRGETLEE